MKIGKILFGLIIIGIGTIIIIGKLGEYLLFSNIENYFEKMECTEKLGSKVCESTKTGVIKVSLNGDEYDEFPYSLKTTYNSENSYIYFENVAEKDGHKYEYFRYFVYRESDDLLAINSSYCHVDGELNYTSFECMAIGRESSKLTNAQLSKMKLIDEEYVRL